MYLYIYVYIYISEKATAQQDKILRQTKKRQVSVDKSLVMKSDEGFLHSTGTTIIHGEALTCPIHWSCSSLQLLLDVTGIHLLFNRKTVNERYWNFVICVSCVTVQMSTYI